MSLVVSVWCEGSVLLSCDGEGKEWDCLSDTTEVPFPYQVLVDFLESEICFFFRPLGEFSKSPDNCFTNNFNQLWLFHWGVISLSFSCHHFRCHHLARVFFCYNS